MKVRSVCGVSAIATLPVAAGGCMMFTTGKTASTQPVIQEPRVSSAMVYPNPNNGNYTVKISSQNKSDDATIEIVNVYGQTLQTFRGINKQGMIDVPVSGHNLVNGMYWVHYRIGNETGSVKMLIEN